MTEVVTVCPSTPTSRAGGAASVDGRRLRSQTRNSSVSTAVSSDLDEFAHHDASTSTPADKRSHSAQTDSPVRASPKYEAFVMTGDKILSLNPKISPSYAKVHRSQLPPTIEIDNTTPKRRGPFDDVPGFTSSRIPVKSRRFNGERPHLPESTSDHHLESQRAQDDGSPAGSEVDVATAAAGNSTAAAGETRIDVHSSTSNSDAAVQQEHNHSRPHNNSAAAGVHHSRTMATADSVSTLPEAAGLHATPQRHHPPNNKHRTLSSRDDDEFDRTTVSIAINNGDAEPTVPNQVYHSTTSMPRCNDVQGASSLSGSKNAVNVVGTEAFQMFVRRLFDLNGYSRLDVSNYFTKPNEVSQRVVEEFMALFNFAGLRIDAALREFLDHVCLTGETSDRARILTFFAERYHECNPTLFENFDAIHALACALLLLNTDLHSDVTSKKMTTREFINNLSHTGFQYDRALLKTLYNAVKVAAFQHSEAPAPKKRPSRANSTTQRRIAQVNDAVDYYHGWVMKKEVYDRDGKRTPLGRRKWQMYFATVRGLVLYLHKNERGFEGSQFAAFNNCIRLHHALAEKCHDYKKKQHVFRLVTAKLGEYLIQTSSPEEMLRWMNAINFVAASLSTPALPEPVTSQIGASLQKSALSDAISNLSVHEQLRRHKEKLEEMTVLLSQLRETAPPMKAKGKVVYEYFYRERYLDNERRRYATYVDILQEKCAALSMTSENGKKNSTSVQRNYTISTIQSEDDQHSLRQPSLNTKLLPAYRDGINSTQASNQAMGPRSDSAETHRLDSPVLKTKSSALAQAYAVANGKPHQVMDLQRRADAAKRQTARGGAEPALCDPRDVVDDLDDEISALSDEDDDEDDQDVSLVLVSKPRAH